MVHLRYQIFEKKYPLLWFNMTLFEYFLVLMLAYFFIVMEPKKLIQLIALGIAVVCHEVAHGWVALQFGDPTAEQQGRLTLNPLKHIDPLGTILVPLVLVISGAGFLIGWAKPVPVQIQNFKHPVRDMMWVALAGPLTNITLACLFGFILKIMILIGTVPYWMMGIITFCQISVVINLVLVIFNLFPIPPLDGSRILMYFLPYDMQSFLMKMEPYGLIIVLILAYFGVFSIIMGALIPPILRIII